MATQQFFDVQLVQKLPIAKDVLELRFEKPRELTFQAGQFVQFQIPLENGHVLRSYSVSSHPDDPYLEFCAKLLDGGKASDFFAKIQEGERALVSTAKGMFICKPEHHPVKVFIATGTGLAPVISMVRSRLNSGEKIHVLFGVRNEADLFWVERLKEYAQQDPNFSYAITLSQPSDSWAGLSGRVTDHVKATLEPANYYLCGSLPMVKDVRAKLTEQGVTMKQIHFEIF